MEEQPHLEFELRMIMGPLERNEVECHRGRGVVWILPYQIIAFSGTCHGLITMHTMTLNCYLVEILIIPLEVCHLLIKASDPLFLFDLADASCLCYPW